MIHEITIKRSIRRSSWQVKGENHTIYDLSPMESVILRLLKELEADPKDKRQVYLLRLSGGDFDGAMLSLTKENEFRDAYGMGCFYTARGFEGFESRIFMSSCFHQLMNLWPDELYLSLEETQKRIMIG